MRLKWMIAFLFLSTVTRAELIVSLSSPDQRIQVQLIKTDRLYFSVYYDSQILLLPSEIDLIPEGMDPLSANLTVRSINKSSNNSFIIPPVPEKRSRIPDLFNQVSVQFRRPFSLILRVYNDGIAYRLATGFKDSIVIKNEIASFNFPVNAQLYFPEVIKRNDADIFHSSFEEPYTQKPLDSLSGNQLFFSPVLASMPAGPRIVITESDLDDYPGMFLTGNQSFQLKAVFAPYPLEETIIGGEFKQAIVTKRASYIARTKGTRDFPWRVCAIAGSDRDLPGNDIVYRLSAPSKIEDASWIHPGKGTDEWIIGINLFNVQFKAGINTATYKYYIDFAKQFGFNRIMMDAGWSDYMDLFKINPNLNMDELADYARKKGIKLSMWTLALTLDRQLEKALDQFNKWGVDFIMTDFMDRDDQKMVNFYTRVAGACARHKIMIMYHGAFKPAGFERTWPNAITRESVLGSEYNIWSEKATPDHNLMLPFIRMLAGPLDYEPGLLDNATRETFRPIQGKVMSLGTRCQQLAMFVVYDNPMQIFSGNPSQGLREPEFMHLLGSIPSTWDTTLILEGKVGDYIITARKKGNDWFIAGMTDWTARDFSIPLHFVGEGNYQATICADGINADRWASDYTITSKECNGSGKLELHMAPGGGFLVRLVKK